MKNPIPFIITGIISLIGCAVFILLNIQIAAGALGVISFVTLLGANKWGTAAWLRVVLFLSAIVAGYAICPPGNFPFLSITFVLFVFVPMFRMAFYKQLGHTNAGLFEAFVYAAGIGFYVFGNLHNNNGWIGWVLPIPAMTLVGYIAMGYTMDYFAVAKSIRSYGTQVGKPAPQFTLQDQDGNATSLSDFKGKRHVLLVFVRGDWCPTCHIMLRTYERFKDKFAEKNIMIMAIGPDPVGVNRGMVESMGLDYKILADEAGEAAKAYGTAFQDNMAGSKYKEGIPLPAAFLIDINGTLIYTSDPHKPGAMLVPETIFPVVEKLQYA
jgi:peroxiredoxin